MASATLPSNRYRPLSGRAIVYNVDKTTDGWKVEAQLPRGLSPEDKFTVLSWFQDYRSQIRRAHPLWVTRFYTANAGYVLEVRTISGPRDLVENGQNLKAIWTDEIANRG